MSKNAQKQDNQFKSDEIKRNVRRDKKVNDTVDRARMSWILNLIFKQKPLGEIIKDIADGILDFKEIEDIFSWKFVQELRQSVSECAENEGNEFKNMTDERMKVLLTLLLNRKSRDELLKLITDHSLSLDNIQKSYLRRHIEEDEKGESSMATNVSTNLNKLSSQEANNTDSKNNKESKDTSTKKRNTVKKGEKDLNTKKKGNNLVEKAAKKVRVVKLKNEKGVGDINGGNKVGGASKELSSIEENPLPRVDDEKASRDLTESLIQNRHEAFEESSLKFSQGDRAAYNLLVRCDTKKMAKSKSLANDDDDAKLASGKKVSEKIGKDVKPGLKNKEKHEVGNNASLLWRNDDYIEKEKEKPKSDESDIENEVTRTSYAMQNDCLSNEIVNPFSASSQEQSISNNKENELNHILEHNASTPKNSIQTNQLDTNTLTKLNGGIMMRIKEEPKSECSSNEFDQPNLDEKILNISKDASKKVDSRKKLQTKRSKASTNTKKSKTSVSKSKKVNEPSKITTAKRNSNRAVKKTTERETKDTRRKESAEDKWRKMRKLDREERRKRKKIRRHEKRMTKAMAQFSDEAIKLVKKMGYLEEADESSSSYSSESSCSSSSESSCSSSSESSYSSSSESCSCSSCCDYSSDEYSEFTLCSCSNCCSSCSYSDFDRGDEE